MRNCKKCKYQCVNFSSCVDTKDNILEKVVNHFIDKERINQQMLKYRNGDDRAFDEVFQTMYGPLMAFVYGKIKNVETCKDVVQNIFMTVLIEIRKIRTLSSCFGLIYAVARCQTWNYINKEIHEKAKIDKAIADYDTFYDDQEDWEFNFALRMECAKLKPVERQILEFRYLGYELYEIAEFLETSPSTIKRKLRIIEYKLRRRFHED